MDKHPTPLPPTMPDYLLVQTVVTDHYPVPAIFTHNMSTDGPGKSIHVTPTVIEEQPDL